MIKQLVMLAAASAVATAGWTEEAQHASKHEAIGVGSGAVIGAAAGGPVGFILGAAFGGWVGDRFDHEREARVAAEERYAEAASETDELEKLLALNKREIGRLESQLTAERRDHARALEEALNIQVYFRTEESKLDEDAAERLARIGKLIGSMDGVVVMLEGHADARGDVEYNEALSAARAESVRDIFVEAGVPAERIAVSAEGETQATAAENDVDALALERRVEISIAGSTPQRVAQRQGEIE